MCTLQCGLTYPFLYDGKWDINKGFFNGRNLEVKQTNIERYIVELKVAWTHILHNIIISVLYRPPRKV